jgi:hypothetical protein
MLIFEKKFVAMLLTVISTNLAIRWVVGAYYYSESDHQFAPVLVVTLFTFVLMCVPLLLFILNENFSHRALNTAQSYSLATTSIGLGLGILKIEQSLLLVAVYGLLGFATGAVYGMYCKKSF